MRGRQICAANISECSASEWCASKSESGPVPQMGVACAAARTSLPGFEDGELLFEAEGRATSRSGLVCPGLLLWVLWSLAHPGLQRNFHSHHSRNGLPSAGPASAATPPSSAGATREGFAFDQARMPRTALCIHAQGQALHHMYIVSLRACTSYHRTCDCKCLTALDHEQHSRPWEAPAWATRCRDVCDDAGISQQHPAVCWESGSS